MKFPIQIPLACLLVCGFYSCGDSGVDAKEAISDAATKVGDMTPDAVKEMAPELVKDAAAKLGEIKDLASAESVTKLVGPMLDKLKSAKGMLGDKMPDMASLSGAVETLKTKFGGDTKIMAVIQPILDQIKGLMG